MEKLCGITIALSTPKQDDSESEACRRHNGFGKNSEVADAGQCGGSSSSRVCTGVLFYDCIFKTARPTTFFEQASIHTYY